MEFYLISVVSDLGDKRVIAIVFEDSLADQFVEAYCELKDISKEDKEDKVLVEYFQIQNRAVKALIFFMYFNERKRYTK